MSHKPKPRVNEVKMIGKYAAGRKSHRILFLNCGAGLTNKKIPALGNTFNAHRKTWKV